MRDVTCEQMQPIDRRGVEEHGVSLNTLMEKFGRAVADGLPRVDEEAIPLYERAKRVEGV